MIIATLTLQLLILHSLNGEPILINPHEITSLRGEQTKHEGDKHFAPNAKCLINMTDGKFVSVMESCEEVYRSINRL